MDIRGSSSLIIGYKESPGTIKTEYWSKWSKCTLVSPKLPTHWINILILQFSTRCWFFFSLRWRYRPIRPFLLPEHVKKKGTIYITNDTVYRLRARAKQSDSWGKNSTSVTVKSTCYFLCWFNFSNILGEDVAPMPSRKLRGHRFLTLFSRGTPLYNVKQASWKWTR